MKRGLLMQLGLGMALTGMALTGAHAEDSAPKPPKDATLAGPKPDKGAPKGKDFGGGQKKEGQFGPIEKILKNLNLTEDQETKIKGLMKSFADKRMQFEAENKVKFEDFKTQVEQAKAAGDKAKLDALHEQKRAIEKGAPKRDELISQISDVLTPEQREKFREQIKEHIKSMNADKGPKEPKMMKDGSPKEKKHDKGDKGGKGKDQLNL